MVLTSVRMKEDKLAFGDLRFLSTAVTTNCRRSTSNGRRAGAPPFHAVKEAPQHARLSAKSYRAVRFHHGNSGNSREQCISLSTSPIINISSLITRTPDAEGGGPIPSLFKSPAPKSYHEKPLKKPHSDSPTHCSDAASSAFFLFAVTWTRASSMHITSLRQSNNMSTLLLPRDDMMQH